MTEHIIAVTQMVSDELSMLYTTVNNDDDEVDKLDGDDVVSSQSESDDDNDPEEGELQTPQNPVNPVNQVTENIVPQWESSQWFSSARYDYTHSGVFLDMGSGSPIDDLVESGTIQLLYWNDSMTGIQLGMRFVDKVQAISRFISVFRENGSRAYAYVPEIYSRQTYRRTYQANFHPVLSENFWRDVPFNLTFYPPNMKKERDRK
ncbi:hypothetical protein M9H77_33921 [Catharanthus roseus]|uniref:Uncharacterized protein n=1 Tax=Catharanthus roseus TaxID=4058 RepID=A0ACB9ZJP0_CATRO|nr:hypothetical protein M9H77_33921 [Catharanthus roseus]